MASLRKLASDMEAQLDQLFVQLYGELRRLAHHRVRSKPAAITTTALVHECFERMHQAGCDERERAHFLGYAARAMRSVLVDDARRRLSQRRGDGATHLSFEDQQPELDKADELLKVHESLDALDRHDPRLRQIVEMRYFGGLSDREISQAIGVAERTVQREWHKARRLLHALMVTP